MSLRKKILFIIGSPNQTTQMHAIASRLPEYDCYFSQLYSRHPIVRLVVKSGLLDNTILSGEFKRKGDAYLAEHRLRNDYARRVCGHTYDMAVLCTDLLVTKELRKLKTVWVQEGMTDPITPWGQFSRRIGLPAYWAMNTAFNGGSNLCDIYCAASSGYKEQFNRLGTESSRIVVTGIPNYDHAATLLQNNFSHRGYVMVATSDTRETMKRDNREKFIKDCVMIAGGRQLLFKLHPNEQRDRAIAEIRSFAPSDAMIYTEGNTGEMIANCDELITQYSTVVYTGIALGKKVHSYFDVDKLQRLAPIQNDGKSAALIADICRRYIEHKGTRAEFLTALSRQSPKLQLNEYNQKDRYDHPGQKRVFPVAG